MGRNFFKIMPLLAVFFVLIVGSAAAAPSITGSFGDTLNGPESKTISSSDSFKISYDADSQEKFNSFVYVTQNDCAVNGESDSIYSANTQYDEEIDWYYAGVIGEEFTAADIDKSSGEYNVCFVAYLTDSVNMESSFDKLSLTIENANPEFTDVEDSYEISMADGDDQEIVDLSSAVTDADGDTLTFDIVSSPENSVASCNINNGVLQCSPAGEGSTSLTVEADDGNGGVATKDIALSVTGGSNSAPYFENLDTSYSYDVSEGEGEIFSVDLSNHGQDDDGDSLTYSQTSSSSLVDCTLADTTLTCDYVGSSTGTADVDVSVSDGLESTTETITLQLNGESDSEPEAVMDIPSNAKAGEEVVFDASESTGGDGADIVKYEWSIAGYSYMGESVTHTFDSEGTYDVELTVTDENGAKDSVTESLRVYSPNAVDLEVNYIRIDGEKHDPYDENDQVLRVNRGQELPIKLKVSAHSDVEDVQISAKIAGYEYSQYEQDDIFQMSDTFDLDADRWDTRELTLNVPTKVATGDTKLRIYVEDKNSNAYIKEYNLDIEGVDNSDAVQIREAYLSPSNEVLPGRALSALVKVENFGEKPLDDVTLKAEVPQLNIRDTETLDELDVDETETFEKTLLRFPKDTKPGDYEVVYTVSFNEYEKTTLRDTVTVLDGEGTSGEGRTVVNVPDSQELTIGGNGAIYPISITNNGDSSSSYKLSVNGVDNWGSYRIDPSSMIVIPAGETKTAYLYVFADSEQEAGVKNFNLDITADGETKQVPLSAALNEGDEKSGDGLGDTFFIVLAVFIIVVIIAAIIFGMSRARNKQSPEDDDEYY